MASALPTFPKFTIHDDDTSLGQRWQKWIKRSVFLAAYDITVNKRKRALLLHSAGDQVQDLFETLPNRGEADNYKAAKDALNAYFIPKVNKAYEVYVFRNAKQNEGETLASYHTRLRQLAETCSFANVEEEIKSHIILSCSSQRLRRRTLRVFLFSIFSLQDLLDYGRSFEVSEKQAQGIERAEDSTHADLKVQRIQQSQAK